MDASSTLAAQVARQQKSLDELKASNESLSKEGDAKNVANQQAAFNNSVEKDRKSIDWWFAALAIMTTVVAALGALLPFLLGRKDKELLHAELRNAKDLVASIKANHKMSEEIVEKAQSLLGYTVEGSNSTQNNVQIDAEVKKVSANPQKYSDIDPLRARAIKASQGNSITNAQAKTALALWNAISALDETDPSAVFNAAYWSQELAEQVVGTQLAAAQTLWRSAGEKYALALRIKPDMHEAANNWGIALIKQASEVAKNDLPAAQTLWAQAETLLEKHGQALL